MSVFPNEKELKPFLEEKIKGMPYCKDVWVGTNFEQRFYSQGRKLFTKDPSESIYPLPQPEIDLIVRDTSNKLFGVEVKYLKFNAKAVFPPRPDKSYYVGIGQTLALLMFGFDCVSLWHCFDSEDGKGDLGSILRYATATHKLVTALKLPIDYYALRIRRKRDIKEVVYLPLSRDWDELPPGLPPLQGKANPLRSIAEVKRMNEFLRLLLIINAHEQKHRLSCIPSAVEIVLKLLEKVDTNYYDLQNNWGKKSNGSLGDFNGKAIKGITFERIFAVPRNSSFSMEEFFQVIDDELTSGRYVIISLPKQKKWHTYIIYAKANEDYLVFSKSGKRTVFLNGLKSRVYKMQKTDILIYKP